MVGLVSCHPRVDQGRFAAERGARGAVGCDLVHGATDADGTAGAHLVAQGVGQGLAGVRRVDLVAVVVQHGVDGAKGAGAVAAKDAARCAAQGDARDRSGVGLDGREGKLADRRRTPSLLPGDDRPQLFTE